VIVGSGNDYLICLKGNQPRLLAACLGIIASCPARDCDDRFNRGHGRDERRIVSVWDAPCSGDRLAIDPSWSALRQIIRVERVRRVGQAAANTETTYYICSRMGDTAYTLGRLIRGHWEIENRLHWVKDVIQNEDANRIGQKNAASVLSLLKTWVLSLFRLNGYNSIKNATITFANKIPQLMALMRT
jgi:predicted transposase YbfD/YdcC